MENKQPILIILLLANIYFAGKSAISQVGYEFTSTNKSAVKYYKKAETAYRLMNYDEAESNLLKALDKDPVFIEAHMLLGDLYMETTKPEDAILAFEKAVAIDSSFFNAVYYLLGSLYYDVKDFSKSVDCLKYYMQIPGLPSLQYRRGFEKLELAEFANKAYSNPVPFNPVNPGDSINSAEDEYINAISTDRLMLLFTRREATDTIAGQIQYSEKVFQSDWNEGAWTLAKSIQSVINELGNIGAVTISPDGRYLFFTACHAPGGHGSCDLFYMVKNGDAWSEPQNLGSGVSTYAWESQPSFSSDGRTLYFASNRSGGKGSSDIWRTVLQDDGSWSKPVNLGPPINTSGEEMAPYIHPDDMTLYYSSEGHRGLGGLDLFYSKRDSTGLWMKPVNLGYPINTEADEINIIIDPSGEMAFISSDKLGGMGRYDIYEFELHPDAKPLAVTYMKGRVFDAETKLPLLAQFELIDLSSGDTRVEAFSDATTGEFLLVLPTDKEYALNVSKTGYLFYSDNFSLKGIHAEDDPFMMDIYLKPVKIGQIMVMKNIFFDTDKYDLKPESIIELDKLIQFLNENPGVKIEISGHTDNVGTADYNIELSDKRAKAVFYYLVEDGISADRLTSKGYGLTRPVDTNETKEGRANNRRTEVEVVAVGSR